MLFINIITIFLFFCKLFYTKYIICDEDYDNNSNIIDDLDEIEYINNEIIKNYEFEEEYNKII